VSKEKSKLKIGYILDGGLEKPDGVQQYILALGGWMKSQGHEVRYIVAGNIAPGITHAISLSRSIEVSSNGNSLTIPRPVSRKKLKDYLNKEQFDVLHVQTPYSPLMGEQLIFLSPKSTAVIGTFHVVPYNKLLSIGNWLLGHYCHFSIKRFDKMFSVSPAAQKIAKRDFRIDSSILPNVIDYAKFSSATPVKKYQDGKINILFFGRLVERKGCIYLLKAIVNLKDRGIDIKTLRVIVAGSGPQAKELKDFATNNNLAGVVEFTGFVEEVDKPKYYASADIAVFPALGGESFGIVLIEAMCSGHAAVLGGANDGYGSVLAAQPELLFKVKDDNELTDKLVELLDDETKRHNFASWARSYAKEYDVNVVGARLEATYLDTVFAKNRAT
jgi:phosphatidylinositol alpha-mannosyltransferase